MSVALHAGVDRRHHSTGIYQTQYCPPALCACQSQCLPHPERGQEATGAAHLWSEAVLCGHSAERCEAFVREEAGTAAAICPARPPVCPADVGGAAQVPVHPLSNRSRAERGAAEDCSTALLGELLCPGHAAEFRSYGISAKAASLRVCSGAGGAERGANDCRQRAVPPSPLLHN